MSLRCRRPTSFALQTAGCWKAILTFSQHTAAAVALGSLVGRSLDADVDVVFAGDGGRLVVADVAIKSFKFRLVAVYAPNIAVERVSFRRLASFLDDSKWLVLMGDWNAILDPKIDKVGRENFPGGGWEDFLTVELARKDLERESSEHYKGFVVRSRLKRVLNEAVKTNVKSAKVSRWVYRFCHDSE